ncbi:hypothetical protein CDL15_Pgr023853 [Punica granatum]|uniref:Uncharacterized protein n=1 Tax=Punica granatum TaxID=22663 RepID=A0A218VZ62_PUNGR|nr:hypothetical protein CDL15_Pgr023853 [Punica granatum]
MSPQRSQTAPIPRATSTSVPEVESSTQAAMRAELHSIREERVDSVAYSLTLGRKLRTTGSFRQS